MSKIRLKRLFWVAAFPIASVALLLFHGEYETALVPVGIGSILLGATFGLFLTGVAYCFTRRFRFSGCAFVLLMGIMGFIGLICGGGLGLGGFLLADNRLPVGNWEFIGRPSEKPAEIVALPLTTGGTPVCNLGIYVRTAEGDIYGCPKRPIPNCEKVQLSAERLAEFQNWPGRGDSVDPLVPPAPGRIVASLECEETWEETRQYNYIILEDGGIWRWTWRDSWFGLAALFLLGAVGLLTGVGVSLFVVTRDWKTVMAAKPDEPKPPV